jgi:hypothetical protein
LLALGAGSSYRDVMAGIINLRLARKAKGRSDKAQQAEVNRTAHGRTKAEKSLIRAQAHKAKAVLDGARRERLNPGRPAGSLGDHEQ